MDLIYEGITTKESVRIKNHAPVRMDLIYEGITTKWKSSIYSYCYLGYCQNGPDLRRDYDGSPWILFFYKSPSEWT